MKMAKINGNTDTEAIIDSVRMFAEGKDVMTSEIVRKTPFKYFFIESDLRILHRARNCNLRL